jgi:hypothetical protein
MSRKWNELSQEEKDTLLPFIESARQARAQGNVEAEQTLKKTIAALAKSYDLDQSQWSLETLNKTGCLPLILTVIATLLLAGCIHSLH